MLKSRVICLLWFDHFHGRNCSKLFRFDNRVFSTIMKERFSRGALKASCCYHMLVRDDFSYVERKNWLSQTFCRDIWYSYTSEGSSFHCFFPCLALRPFFFESKGKTHLTKWLCIYQISPPLILYKRYLVSIFPNNALGACVECEHSNRSISDI